jgi:two-component system nitrogen regulation response regulator GlnG
VSDSSVPRTKPALAIVDDDPLITETLGYILGREFEVMTSASRGQCIEQVRAAAEPPALALVDLGLPPTPHRPDEGFALISELLAHSPQIRIVVLSGQNDEANARHARSLGALEFIAKPADPEQLTRTLRQLLRIAVSEPGATSGADPCGLVGESPPIQKLRAQVKQYAESPFPVLIEGESGSGKEIVAHGCLHLASSRRDKPYSALNCAAISATLLEPALFGCARGAFTGAIAARSGYFEDAGDGTLFLDEIGELPPELQPKLLRVLENGEYQRVGETQPRQARCRVVAATNRDLRREVREGRFRADLYHRLSVFTIAVPPLREMGDDRFLLLSHYRTLFSAQMGQPPFRLSEPAEVLWREYPFPGNVRELRNIVVRLLARHAGQTVSAEALAVELDFQDAPENPAPPRSEAELSDLAARHLQQRGQFRLDETLGLWERAYIDAAMRLTHGNVSQAARLLGINRTTLYNRMESLAREMPAGAGGQ